MPGRFNVYVFEDSGTYYVRPAVAMVSRTLDIEGVKVRNLTNKYIELHFADQQHASPAVHIGPGEIGNIGFQHMPVADDIFDYCVDVILDWPTNAFKVPALGNSFPKIIIDP